MPGMPPEFRALLERYNQLGRLLPSLDDAMSLIEDDRARAGIEVVLAEMARVKAQIDDFVAAAKARRLVQ